MKNILFTAESVKMQITDSISKNLTDSDLAGKNLSNIYVWQPFPNCEVSVIL